MMLKRYICLFFAITILISSTVYATPLEDIAIGNDSKIVKMGDVWVPVGPVEDSGDSVQVFDDETMESLEANTDFPEQMAASMLMSIPNFIVRLLYLEDLIPLVYGKVPPKYYKLEDDAIHAGNSNYRGSRGSIPVPAEEVENAPKWLPPEEKAFGVFLPAEAALIYKFQQAIIKFLPIAIITAVAVVGFLTIWGSTSSQNMDNIKSMAQGFLVMVVLLKFSIEIWNILFTINKWLVNLAWSFLSSKEQGLSFLDMLWRPETKSLGMAIASTIAAFMIATMNFQYNVRKIMLGILFIATPFVAYASLFQVRKDALNIYKSELVGNIFLQSAHAIVLTIFVKWITVNPSFWLTMAFLLSFNSMMMLVRNTLGLSRFEGKSVPSMAGNLLGVGALMAIPRLFSAVTGRGSAASKAIKGTGAEGVKAAAASASTNTAASATGSAAAAFSPIRNFRQNMAVKGASLIGASALGIGGMFAGGMAFAAAGQNATAGALIGGAVGSKAGYSTGKGAAKAGVHAENLYRDYKSSGSLTFKDYLNDKAGFYDSSQLYDVEQMIALGQNYATTLFGDGAAGTGQMVGEILGKRNADKAMKNKQAVSRQIEDAVKRNEPYNPDNSTFASGVDHEVNIMNNRLLNNTQELLQRYKVNYDEAERDFEVAKIRLQQVEYEYGKYTPEYKVEYENLESCKANLQNAAAVYGRRSLEYKQAHQEYEQARIILENTETTYGKFNEKYIKAQSQYQEALNKKLNCELKFKSKERQYEKQRTAEETIKRLNKYRRNITKKVVSESGFDSSWAVM